MWASLEPLSGLLRVFTDDKSFGDSYSWCATVRYIDQQTVEILGITKAPKPSEWRAIIQLFNSKNVETIIFYRKDSEGNNIKKTINVKNRRK